MDAFNGYHMGNTAENVAAQWQITRDEQDQFARRLAEQGRGGAEGRQVQGRDRRRSPSRAARATSSSTRTNTSAHGATLDAHRQAAPGLREGRHGDRRQRLGHQ